MDQNKIILIFLNTNSWTEEQAKIYEADGHEDEDR